MFLAQVDVYAAQTTEQFNADFYLAIATVIPVLFLAIAVQSRIYDDLLKAIVSTWHRVDETELGDESKWKEFGIAYSRLIFVPVAILFAAAIVICGVVGEIQALRALEDRHEESNVLEYTIILLVATAAAPALALGRSALAVARIMNATGKAADARIAADDRTGQPIPPSKLSKAVGLGLSALLAASILIITLIPHSTLLLVWLLSAGSMGTIVANAFDVRNDVRAVIVKAWRKRRASSSSAVATQDPANNSATPPELGSESKEIESEE